MVNKKKFTLQCYSLPELAVWYKVSDDTFRKWLKPFATAIGPRTGRFYSINQVLIILDKLGWPDAELPDDR
jgi:hypothetical protein